MTNPVEAIKLFVNDPSGFMAQIFVNPAGLYALIALIPLVILYLIRPKPLHKTVPSLMFLMSGQGRTQRQSFLKKFLRDFLILLQILILVLIALSLAEPFKEGIKEVITKDQVIIIDNSASSTVVQEGRTRLMDSISVAKSKLADTNTIIVASDFSEMVLEQGSSGAAENALDRIKSRMSRSNIIDAMGFASEFLNRGEGKILVISDMIQTETDSDINNMKDRLQASGIDVELVNIAKKVENVGIVDLVADEEQSTLYIRNYIDRNITFDLLIDNLTRSINMSPLSTESFTFKTPTGVTIIKLDFDDDFKVDNEAYISAPESKETKILAISNEQTTHLRKALEAIPKVEVEVVMPPITPEIDHDIILIDHIDKDLIIPGVIREVSREVKKGTDLIIAAQNNIFGLNFLDMLPVDYLGQSSNGTDMINNKINPLFVTVDFGNFDDYFSYRPLLENMEVIAQDEDGSPQITLNNYGKGEILFYGLLDDDSDFKLSYHYPLFWDSIIKLLKESKRMDNFNKEIGSILLLNGRERITKPDGKKITVATLNLDQIGIYETEDNKYAVNLLDEGESDVNREFLVEESGKVDDTIEVLEKRDMTNWVLFFGLLAVFIELVYVKLRGDF